MACCRTCNNGLSIPVTQPIHEDKHSKHRVCPACGGSANLPDEPFKNTAPDCPNCGWQEEE